MWPVPAWQLAVCGVVTLLAILLGFVYTCFRLKGVKSPSPVIGAKEAHTDKWPSGDSSSEHQDHGPEQLSDPMQYCSHIQSKIKQTQHRIAQQKIESTMTAEERNKEREIQHKQLQEIFNMIEEQKDKFGVNDISDVQDQLKMYFQ